MIDHLMADYGMDPKPFQSPSSLKNTGLERSTSEVGTLPSLLRTVIQKV